MSMILQILMLYQVLALLISSIPVISLAPIAFKNCSAELI